MFVAGSRPRNPLAYQAARALREQEGMPFKQIASLVGVSVSTAHAWTRDVSLTPIQRAHNLSRPGCPVVNEATVRKRAVAWAERNRQKRAAYQAEGRERAHTHDPLHIAGCMLYWAEGSKSRNTVTLCNSDPNMLRLFSRFLRESLGVVPGDFRVRLNLYTDNGLGLAEVEDYWLYRVQAPRSCLRGHSLNHFPTSSSGRKRHRLPYGVCTLRVARSTRLVQHIFGAIQEYGGFDEPRWLA